VVKECGWLVERKDEDKDLLACECACENSSRRAKRRREEKAPTYPGAWEMKYQTRSGGAPERYRGKGQAWLKGSIPTVAIFASLTTLRLRQFYGSRFEKRPGYFELAKAESSIEMTGRRPVARRNEPETAGWKAFSQSAISGVPCAVVCRSSSRPNISHRWIAIPREVGAVEIGKY